jgi:hydrogenase nickel incorporation protein HypA/HybF
VHEFSIAQSICDITLQEARQHGARRVISVTCRVGVLRQLVPDLMETAFRLCAEGTILQDTRLGLETEGVDVACMACGRTYTVHEIVFRCPGCNASEIHCRGGQEITLASMEIEQGTGDGDSDSSAA